MTQGQAKIFETDVVLFPITNEKEVSEITEETEIIEVKKTTLRTDINQRFVRLRKSLRKRSISIF